MKPKFSTKKPVRSSIEFLKSAYQSDQLTPLKGPAVLFFGRSNVGKSSLLNCLTASSLAQVSKQPGKTRSINYYRYGKSLYLVDFPGYGYAKRSKQEKQHWAMLIEDFFQALPTLSLAFVLMDAKRDLEIEEFQLLETLLESCQKICLLFTKADRLKQSERNLRERKVYEQTESLMSKLTAKLNTEKVLTCGFVSVKSGEGIKELRQELYHYEKDCEKAAKVKTSSHEGQRSSSSFGNRETLFRTTL